MDNIEEFKTILGVCVPMFNNITIEYRDKQQDWAMSADARTISGELIKFGPVAMPEKEWARWFKNSRFKEIKEEVERVCNGE